MKLHRALTKVTPLSKTIALVLFIFLPFVGFYVGTRYQATVDVLRQLPPLSVAVITPIQPQNPATSVLDYFISYQIPKGWNKTIDQTTGAIVLRSSEFAHSAKMITGMEIVISKNGKLQKQGGALSPNFAQSVPVGDGKGIMTYSDNPQPAYTVSVVRGTDVWSITFTYSNNLEKSIPQIRDLFISSIHFQQPKGL